MIELFRRWKRQTETKRVNRAVEFYSCIADLITNDRVLKLDEFAQHYGYTRLRHSLDVSYFSFCVARLFGWDARSTARGGLLHDCFFYDWKDEDRIHTGKSHAWEHPRAALTNARQICTLNDIEADIIVKHMWLATIVPPRYKEGFIVTFVDKYCAVREFTLGLLAHGGEPRSLFATEKI